jgi:hypothetical protein
MGLLVHDAEIIGVTLLLPQQWWAGMHPTVQASSTEVAQLRSERKYDVTPGLEKRRAILQNVPDTAGSNALDWTCLLNRKGDAKTLPVDSGCNLDVPMSEDLSSRGFDKPPVRWMQSLLPHTLSNLAFSKLRSSSRMQKICHTPQVDNSCQRLTMSEKAASFDKFAHK